MFNTRLATLKFLISGVFLVTINVFGQYCTKNLPDGFSVFTANFALEEISNISGDAAYADFTSLSATLLRGSSHMALVTTQVAGSSNTQDGAIYIDWNQDLDFNDPGESISFGALANQVTSVIVPVPANALLGNTRMRVITSFFGNPQGVSACDPSGSAGFRIGDVEDYTVKVTTPYFSRASGDWNSQGTWSRAGLGGVSCNCVPDGCGPVTIGNGNTVSVSNSIDITTLTIENTGNLLATTNNISFNVTDEVTIESGGAFDCSGTTGTNLNFTTGTSTLNSNEGAIAIFNNGNANGTTLSLTGTGILFEEDFVVNSGNVVNASSVTINQDLSVIGFSIFSNTANGTVTLKGDFDDIGALALLSNAGTWTWSGTGFDSDTEIAFSLGFMNVFNYAANGNQRVFSGVYNNLNVSGSGVKTLLGNVIVNNFIDIDNVNIALLNSDLTVRNDNRTSDGARYISEPVADESLIFNGSGTLTFVDVAGDGSDVGDSFIDANLETSEASGVNRFFLQNQGTIDDFTISMSEGVLSAGQAGDRILLDAVDRTWAVAEATTGGSSSLILLSWQESHELPGFASGEANRYIGTNWEEQQTLFSNARTLLFQATAFGPFAIDNTTSVLPITLTYFQTEIRDNHVNLKWETATELNNDFFTLEKSEDGEHWSEFGKVDGAGNSTNTIEYSFTDSNPFLGIGYYRLKQTDFDGAFTYPSVEVINFNGLSPVQILIHPNPFDDIINICCAELPIQEISIFDLSGKSVDQLVRKERLSNTQYNLDFTAIDNGVYLIKVGSEIHRVNKNGH